MTMKQLTMACVICSLAGAAIAVTADNSQANSAVVNSSVKSNTADGQSNSPADLKITQEIRKRVMADKSLSTYAHNVKIVTVNGEVTLNGVVRSESEKSAVETKARDIAGADKVISDVTIAPNR